jgi:CheY-like chemotaxis protein
VVDDNNINLHLMMTFMNKRKVVVLDKAENGRAAVDAVENMQQGYDLIFMDMSMPIMDGFEATRAIRAIEKERDDSIAATIIALTGLSSTRDEFRALDSGVDLFLMKPVSFREVSRLIDEWEAKQPK